MLSSMKRNQYSFEHFQAQQKTYVFLQNDTWGGFKNYHLRCKNILIIRMLTFLISMSGITEQ
ncbi:hypothetical protein XBJ1_2908 [Xenorhabdus bovienii SS-2004]|uniref:Uncharacterized protein n=1 Tax=Xenorhabdus bovienii (strain SS-2004) TaxID=406818 RepID=D3V870_XENBS|nr:hypothetical protein XBJ1_2908 [Xenorhabdus bovienii SS-2004]